MRNCFVSPVGVKQTLRICASVVKLTDLCVFVQQRQQGERRQLDTKFALRPDEPFALIDPRSKQRISDLQRWQYSPQHEEMDAQYNLTVNQQLRLRVSALTVKHNLAIKHSMLCWTDQRWQSAAVRLCNTSGACTTLSP